MKNLAKSVVAVAVAVACGNCFAGQYTEYSAHVVSAKANYNGYCFGMALLKDGKTKQGFTWQCDTAYGKNMLSLADTAYLMNASVDLTLEGNGANFKPLSAIQIN